ncbi:TRAP transporter small permease [Tritonibacter horizontis]|uniref:TRAP transporter small permease protein n=1 Tax=Tritonibacter horizontis TaxID=1768241 RepID=A0A132BW39_9RHOB|nr:TRAP transporter small permease [Tritonibacter horizontis]KUP92027.1 tripartite ATP-independent periplasmic transporter, DctQ component [Tritonibacter horizontis]
MRKFVEKLSAVLDHVADLSIRIAGIGLFLMTVFIAWQVFGRFVLNDTPTWTETSSILIMGWFLLLGAAAGIREGNHLSFDVVLFLVNDKAKSVAFTISDFVVIAFGMGMVVYGLQLALKTWPTTIPNLGISGGVAFLALITGGALLVIYSVERLLRRAVGLPTTRFSDKLAEAD